MKTIALIMLCLLSLRVNAQATAPQFTLRDSVFTAFTVYRGCEFLAPQNGSVLVRPEDQPCFDSIAAIMLSHPGMKMEIGVHTDQRGSDSANFRFSQQRADNVRKYLESKGVDRWSIVAVGYGESQPIHQQADIIKIKSKQLQEERYAENRRIEFKILVAGNTFSLSDTSFTVGDILYAPILYDLGKATLRPESQRYLDTVAQFLLAHPQLKIEVRNHTDTRASDKVSWKPSSARAQTVATYLISKGVPATQVTHVGYGDTRPLISQKYIDNRRSKDTQERLHQINRRTEFVITGI